jgi:hypothetical protein
MRSVAEDVLAEAEKAAADSAVDASTASDESGAAGPAS